MTENDAVDLNSITVALKNIRDQADIALEDVDEAADLRTLWDRLEFIDEHVQLAKAALRKAVYKSSAASGTGHSHLSEMKPGPRG